MHHKSRLFDEQQLDVLMVPTLLCEPLTYECVSKRSCVAQLPVSSGGSESKSDYADSPSCSVGDCMFSMQWVKTLPVPKVVVPVGVSAKGHPMSMMFLGRAGPADTSSSSWDLSALYRDASKTDDLDFLYAVEAAVKALHKRPDLQGRPSKLVQGEGNLFPAKTQALTPASATGNEAFPLPERGRADTGIFQFVVLLLVGSFCVSFWGCVLCCHVARGRAGAAGGAAGSGRAKKGGKAD